MSTAVAITSSANDAAPLLGSFVTATTRVAPQETVRSVTELFFANTNLDAVALVGDSGPIGLLTRARLLLKLSRPFAHELFARKPILHIADSSPLVLPARTTMAEAVTAALARTAERVYDDIIVTDEGGRYLGLSSVRRLALEQSSSMAHVLARREAAEARAAELERIDEVRNQLLAHATHELRSPVNAIVGVAELLRMACERKDLEAVREWLPMLLKSAAGLRSLVTNILDLSKLRAGKMDVTLGEVEVASLLEDVADTTRVLVGKNRVDVVVEAPVEPITVRSDAQKVRQILGNLASNAAKFTQAGRIVIGAARRPGRLDLWVSDTGVGIREQDLSRLFVPFDQLEDARIKKEGTGLGLAITARLTDLLGGEITVASRHGEGSVFTVRLPVDTSSAVGVS